MSAAATTPAASALEDLGRTDIAGLMPGWLARQRWFGAKDARVEKVQMTSLGEVAGTRCALTLLDVELTRESHRYFLPLSRVGSGDPALPAASDNPAVLVAIDDGALIDGASDTVLAETLLDGMRTGMVLRHDDRQVVFDGNAALGGLATDKARLLSVEQSNATLAFGDVVVLKIYRRLRAGIQPDVEIARHLTFEGFAQTPALLGTVTLDEPQAEPTVLAAAFAFVPNQGDAWAYLCARLRSALEDGGDAGETGFDLCRLLGSRTAGLHRALARQADDPAFAPEPVTKADLRAWKDEAHEDLREAVSGLESALDRLGNEAGEMARRVLERRDAAFARVDRVDTLGPSGQKQRIHGDYHLGQVLVTEDDVAIIDFEGEPRRSLAARRTRTSGLRDVAGMLRSLDYAAGAAARTAEVPPSAMNAWRRRAAEVYLDAYREGITGCPAYPGTAAVAALLDLFQLQKVAYEISYELSNRPAWVQLPLNGLLALLDEERS